jgi:hypothetical protein
MRDSQVHFSQRTITDYPKGLKRLCLKMNYHQPDESSPYRPTWSSAKATPPSATYELSSDTSRLVNELTQTLPFQYTPKNAQNVKVWNNLIPQCTDTVKYELEFTFL